MKKVIYKFFGLICFALGFLCSVLPAASAYPFLAGAAACFGKSSKELQSRVLNSMMYQESLKDKKGSRLSLFDKFLYLSLFSVFVLAGMIAMKDIPAGFAALAAIWVLHMIHFCADLMKPVHETVISKSA